MLTDRLKNSALFRKKPPVTPGDFQVSTGILQITAYRSDVTGAFFHIYRDPQGQEAARVSQSVIPGDVPRLEASHRIYSSKWDPEVTLFPGLRRYLEDEQGQQVGFYEYRGTEVYRLVTFENAFDIQIRGENVLFLNQGKTVAVIQPISGGSSFHDSQTHMDLTPRFRITYHTVMPELEAAMAATFPNFRFAP